MRWYAVAAALVLALGVPGGCKGTSEPRASSRVTCGDCHAVTLVNKELHLGDKVKCSSCKKKLTINSIEQQAPAPTSNRLQSSTSNGSLWTCPECDVTSWVTEQPTPGARIRCSSCNKESLVREEPPRAALPESKPSEVLQSAPAGSQPKYLWTCPQCSATQGLIEQPADGSPVRCKSCYALVEHHEPDKTHAAPAKVGGVTSIVPDKGPVEEGTSPRVQSSPLLADQIAPRDLVTNRRVPNVFSVADEIASCEKQKEDALRTWRSGGIAIDGDPGTVEKLKAIMTRIAKVSHAPDYPWEIHLIGQQTSNAFTIGGGKLFVYTGVLGGEGLVQSDLELSALMAHEMAHVTCRHVPESMTWTGFGSLMSQRIAGGRYKATYSTDQEDEADRVGLLYMALAGYDPRAMSPIWLRAHQKYGSDPGTYVYDHSLHIDRARKTEAAGQIATKYYSGSGIVNPQAAKLLLKNDLVDREETGSENEVSALIEAAANTYLDHLKTRQEEAAREKAVRQSDQEATQLAMALKGMREYRCFRCSKTVWAKPGSRGTCPHCKALLVVPK